MLPPILGQEQAARIDARANRLPLLPVRIPRGQAVGPGGVRWRQELSPMQSVAERLECLPESRIEVRDGVGLVVSKPEYVDAKGVTPRGGTQEECVVGLGDGELEGEGPGRGVGALRRAVRIEASPESRDRFLHPPIARCEGTHSSVNHVGISRSSIWLSSGRPMKPRSQNSCVTGAPSFPVLTKGPRMVSIGSGTSAASHLTTPRSSRSFSAIHEQAVSDGDKELDPRQPRRAERGSSFPGQSWWRVRGRPEACRGLWTCHASQMFTSGSIDGAARTQPVSAISPTRGV